MTTPKPPPRTLQPAEERKIQLFLERAAPIVLEDPQLTSERWQVLAALANELDLTADQFRSTIDDLMSRGVIKKLEVTPPKPPPLPGRRGVPGPPSKEVGATEDFALSPPAGPPPAQAPQPASAVSQPEPPRSSVAEKSSNGADGRAVVDASLAATPARNPSKRERFLERATAILAEQRGLNVKSHTLLAAAAQELGLSDGEAREALETLHHPPEVKTAAANLPAATDKLSATRWRVEGAPAPIPPPPPKSPAETFMDFVRPSLAAVRDGVVSQELEQRLVAHGRRVLGLSAVYVQHLLLDLVAERKLRLASGAETEPPAAAPDAAPADPKRTEFLEAAKPILAVHRGFNPQSRVLLTALARERGMTEQEVEQAIGTLAPRDADTPVDRLQQERLVPFRSHVESGLKKVPRGIVTPSMHDRLVNAGVELYGLGEVLASAAVREVTTKLQLAVITHEQAERHLTNLLADMVPPGATLTRAQRDRIESEGSQWGMPPARVTSLIDDQLRENAEKARTEQRISQWAISGAVAALVIVLLFFLYTAIARSNRKSAAPPTLPTEPATVPESKPIKEASWVDSHSDLAISVINARSDLPLLRKPLNDLSSNDAARRDTAYDAIVEYFFFQSIDEIRRKDLAELLSYCLALEPTESSAGRLLNALLKEIAESSDKPTLDALAFPRMFWGVQTVAMALARAKGEAERVSQIVAALHRTVGVTPDPNQPSTELEQVCAQSLAERLFRTLISAAGGALPNSAPLHAALVNAAGKYLDVARLDKFNAEFLAAALGKEPSLWKNFEDLLRQASAARDPLAVLQLVELYESTGDSALREFLAEVLLMRIPGSPPGRTVEEVAAFVRQGLGITDSQDPDGIWTKLSRESKGVLDKANSPPEPTTPLLAEVLQLAHYTTLACAFAQNEWGNASAVEWRKAGPQPPDAGMASSPTEGVPDSARSTPSATMIDRATVDAFRAAAAPLAARRSQPAERLAALTSLARMSEQAPDVPPEFASALATYLLASKSSTEHARVLQELPTLAKWNQLLIALADRFDDGSLTEEHLQSLLTTLLGRELSIAGAKDGRAVARREVFDVVMRRLGTTETRARQPVGVAENAASLLAHAYATQARLLGIALPESIIKGRDPTATLRAMIDEFQSRLSAAKLTEPQRAELARVPHERTAMEFLAGTNDVQRLVAMERTWLRLLALEAARRNEARSTEARQVVTNLQQKDQPSKHVLSQLRDGQAAMLQMWLLIGKRG